MLLLLTAAPVRAQWVVFDPANHVEAVMEVAGIVNNVQQNIRQVRNSVKEARRLYGDVTYLGDQARALLTGEMTWRDLESFLRDLDTAELDRLLSDLQGVAGGRLVLYGESVDGGAFERGFDELYVPISEETLFGRPFEDTRNGGAHRLNRELQKLRQLMAVAVEAEAGLFELGLELETLRTEVRRAESGQAIAEANARLNAFTLEESMRTQKLLTDLLYADLDRRATREAYLADDIRRFSSRFDEILGGR